MKRRRRWRRWRTFEWRNMSIVDDESVMRREKMEGKEGSTTAAVISDDLPWLAWTALLWRGGEAVVRAVETSGLAPSLVSHLTHPLTIASVKMVITQCVYEPASSATYLSVNTVLRGGGLRAVRRELRSKLFGVWRTGLAFKSTTSIVAFMMPFWWMSIVVDSVGTVLFVSWGVAGDRLAIADHQLPTHRTPFCP